MWLPSSNTSTVNWGYLLRVSYADKTVIIAQTPCHSEHDSRFNPLGREDQNEIDPRWPVNEMKVQRDCGAITDAR